jgi:hypothetical protein
VIKIIAEKILFKFGWWPIRLQDKESFLNNFKNFRPIFNGHNLVRIGGSGDGGYLVPDDLVGINFCLSPGVAETWDFEKDLYGKYRIPSLMLDASVDRPLDLNSEFIFLKKFIGPANEDNVMTISSLLENHIVGDPDLDLVLQMDIEGAEYFTLLATDETVLKKFRIIIIEFHQIENWSRKISWEDFYSGILNKLFSNYDVVHVHGNNAGKLFKFGKFKFPATMEVTFHRKDRNLVPDQSTFRDLPNLLDRRNNLSKPEVILPFD